MVFFNYALRKLNAKIVYYGPGLCGKTTNLQWIHDHFEGGQRGKMISLATEGDRTIFFDLLPIDIGTIRGMDVTLQLYTVPGQVHYNSTRQLVLRGADGVVFVADSQRTMRSSNAESFENLQENLMLQGIDLKEFPHVLQFNKRDLRDLLSPEDLNEDLNLFSVPIFEAIATEGIGVQETLEGIVKLVMRNLREKYEPVAQASGSRAPAPMSVVGPVGYRAEKPAAGVRDPLAPDFVSQVEPTVAPSGSETQAVGPDAGFAAFHDEDGIPTAVYEETDQEIANFEAALHDETEFPVDEDTAPDRVQAADPADFEGSVADPEVELGTGDAGPVVPPVDDFEVPDEAGAEPEIADESFEPKRPVESMDDLFQTETPSVGDFVRGAIERENAGGDVPDRVVPQTVMPPASVVAPPTRDHYEDRIEAPGPFAPPPVGEAREEAADAMQPEQVSDHEQEVVLDEVRQAFGAAEDREALASLWADEARPTVETADRVADEAVEAHPVMPPAGEPEPLEHVSFVDEATPTSVESPPVDEPDFDFEVEPTFVADEPEPDIDAVVKPTFEADEPDIDTVLEPTFEADEPDIEAVAEPAFEAVEAAVPEFREPPIAELEPEPEPEPVPEPVVDEPEAEEPIIDRASPIPPSVDEAILRSQPIMVGIGDPFADDEIEAAIPQVMPADRSLVAARNTFDVRAEDNQLHLQLRGSGAIAEMGQVRALDIEVPVPGQWVGNRKVTLQLRLTLTPAEDEDD